MPKAFFLAGLGVLVVGLVMVPLSGPALPVTVVGAVLSVVGAAVLLGKRRETSHRK
jgi:hypothetical protein